VTNGNAAPIANIPPSISFVLKAIGVNQRNRDFTTTTHSPVMRTATDKDR
jgi:hypothetical protein